MHGSENWALNRSGSMKIETAEMRFSKRASGYTLTYHVHNAAIRNTFQIYALEKRIQDYKNMWHNHILKMDSSRTKELRTSSQTGEET
jgi:hypothetical protein